jgi:hypothetical protein
MPAVNVLLLIVASGGQIQTRTGETMESLLVTSEVIVVTLLTFLLALAVEPLLVMAVLALAKKGMRRPPQPSPEPQVAELRLLATGPKNLPRD